jgi:hypothetical protein
MQILREEIFICIDMCKPCSDRCDGAKCEAALENHNVVGICGPLFRRNYKQEWIHICIIINLP